MRRRLREGDMCSRQRVGDERLSSVLGGRRGLVDLRLVLPALASRAPRHRFSSSSRSRRSYDMCLGRRDVC